MIVPHGPWIILVVTMVNNSGSIFLSGISAEIILSISAGLIFSTHQIKMCVRNDHVTFLPFYGIHPTFYFFKYTKFYNQIDQWLSFCLNTRAVTSWGSDGNWPGNNNFFISSHCGLQVNVMNRSGLPYTRTYFIAS